MQVRPLSKPLFLRQFQALRVLYEFKDAFLRISLTVFEHARTLLTDQRAVAVQYEEERQCSDARIAREKFLVAILVADVHLDGDERIVPMLLHCRVLLQKPIERETPRTPVAAETQQDFLAVLRGFDFGGFEIARGIAVGIVDFVARPGGESEAKNNGKGGLDENFARSIHVLVAPRSKNDVSVSLSEFARFCALVGEIFLQRREYVRSRRAYEISNALRNLICTSAILSASLTRAKHDGNADALACRRAAARTAERDSAGKSRRVAGPRGSGKSHAGAD